MATLTGLLQDADLASLVLGQCSPKALAALECSSRALRALIAGLPTATWQARLLQQADSARCCCCIFH